jgi:hypothetical protein
MASTPSPPITPEEARARILFLSSGYALTEELITQRGSEWRMDYERAGRQHGSDSVGFLVWKCRFAKPAYAAVLAAVSG